MVSQRSLERFERVGLQRPPSQRFGEALLVGKFAKGKHVDISSRATSTGDTRKAAQRQGASPSSTRASIERHVQGTLSLVNAGIRPRRGYGKRPNILIRPDLRTRGSRPCYASAVIAVRRSGQMAISPAGSTPQPTPQQLFERPRTAIKRAGTRDHLQPPCVRLVVASTL